MPGTYKHALSCWQSHQSLYVHFHREGLTYPTAWLFRYTGRYSHVCSVLSKSERIFYPKDSERGQGYDSPPYGFCGHNGRLYQEARKMYAWDRSDNHNSINGYVILWNIGHRKVPGWPMHVYSTYEHENRSFRSPGKRKRNSKGSQIQYSKNQTLWIHGQTIRFDENEPWAIYLFQEMDQYYIFLGYLWQL